jgi:DNA-binding Lrp family transcriptional regulator
VPKRLPDDIDRAVRTIRKEYGHYVQAKFMHGKYRLFEATSIYDPEKKKPKKVTRYLGWLTESGQLIPARHNDLKTKIFNKLEEDTEKKIKELEESLKEAEKKSYEEGIRKKNTEKHERDILRALSMNARITVPELAKITGLGNTAVNYHLRNLERRYDIKYLLEIDIEKFGYINYIAFVKFKDKRPTYEEMKSQLEAIPYVQVAMTTKGIYDMVIFLVVEANSDARSSLYDLISFAFPSYNVDWTMTPAYFGGFGFIPLRDQFFEILKEKVWTRTKEKPRPVHDEITEIEYKVLRAMNDNAAADFTSIDKEIGADTGRSNYAFHQLIKRGIIKRATINMQNINSKFDVMFLLSHENYNEWAPYREKLLIEIIEEKSHHDTYSFTCDTMSPRGVLLITHIKKNENPEEKVEKLSNKIKGMCFNTLIITNQVLGLTNNRLYDKTQSRQYEVLISGYNYTPEKIHSILEHENRD